MWMLPSSTTTAPPLPSFPPGHSIDRVRDFAALPPSDIEALAQLLLGFFSHGSAPNLSVEEAIKHLEKTVVESALWVYRAPPTDGSSSLSPAPVGFLTTGRPTLRTVAIRGVFVSPSHRGKGIAGRAVAAVTRAHLADAEKVALSYSEGPSGEAAAQEEKTRWGGKEEVCLFVEPENAAARKAYARVGFVENGGTWCDVDLEGVEPGHW